MHLVILDELPHEADTLPLRLLGRGRTLQHALTELRVLPHDHVLHARGLPVLFAFRPTMQDLDEARAMLIHLVAHRFGDVPADALQRIAGADHATLMRWATQVLTARSIDDVLA